MQLYGGNLSSDTSEDALRNAFAEFGNVQDVALIMDRDTGRPRGFGFVTMGSPDEGRAAIEAMNGKDLDGRSLNVNEARERTGGGGGGGHRGGGGGGRRGGW